MFKKKGVFIDLDGTLVNSLPEMKRCYYQFMAHVGKQGDDQEFSSLNGPSLKVIVDTLRVKHQLIQNNDELEVVYHELIESSYQNIAPVSDAEYVLRLIKSKGYIIGLVTSNSKQIAEQFLHKNSIRKYFSIVVGGDDVKECKPSPTPYLHALEKMNCCASISIAIEDSVMGILSAYNAGLKTIMIEDDAKEKTKHANLVIKSFSELKDVFLDVHSI